MTTTRLTDADVLRELEPTAAANLDRHLGLAKEWMPHEYVPWGQGRDFVDEPWEPSHSRLSNVAQVAMEVNLLTEDNLPSYHRVIAETFGRDSAWGTWVHRWTAEEGRHGIAMRDYLLTTRGVDPVALERGRMAQMEIGYAADGKTALRALSYVALQELATRISHRNTGRFTDDPIADKLLSRIAADENLHMIFYRDLVAKALEVDPSGTVSAIATEVMAFQMPGAGIVDFNRKALQIARAGIYDLRIHHDEVVQPLLKLWRFFDIEGLDAEAEAARTNTAAYLEALDGMAAKYDALGAARRERQLANA